MVLEEIWCESASRLEEREEERMDIFTRFKNLQGYYLNIHISHSRSFPAMNNYAILIVLLPRGSSSVV